MTGTMTRSAGRSTTSQRVGLLGVLVMLLGLLPLATPAQATHRLGTPQDVTTARYAGDNRFDTAGLIADDVSGGEAPDVLLARGDLYPDALSGNFLAGIRGVPILLMPSDVLHEDTMGWLRTLGTDNITILGETAAISASNEQALKDAGYNVDRIGGFDRYETALLTATEGAQEGTVGTWDGDRTAIVASGENFPDALVAGSLSFSENFPLLLTHPSSLTDDARKALNDLDIQRVIIPGGPVAVSENAENDIEAMGIQVTRIDGERRVTTATEFADFVKAEFGWTYELINIARGDLFPDALTIGPLAGQAEAPLLLTHDPGLLGDATYANGEQEAGPWLREQACQILGLHFAGGEHAIHDSVAAEAEAAAEACDQPAAAVAALNVEHVGASTNQVGDDHTVLVHADDADGDDATGADIRFEVTRNGSATGTPSSGTDEIDANGSATFTYVNNSAGQDTITVCANSDGSLPADCDAADLEKTLTKTWTAEEPLVADSVDANPENATNIVGDVHTVTAEVRDQNGDVLAGANMELLIEAGPHDGLTRSDVSDPNGHAEFTYEGQATGTDTILVWADLNGDGGFDDGEPSDRVNKTWELGEPASVTLSPQDDTNPVGTTHTVAATVRDENNNPLPNVWVRFETTGTVPEAPETGSDTTDAAGVALFTYSRDSAGQDTITACTNLDESEPATCATNTGPEATATKTWQERVPATLDLEEEAATNEVGTEHQVIATVLDQFGDPIDVIVQFEVTGTNPVVPENRSTGPDGMVAFEYTGTNVGDDTIAACTSQDGTPPADGCEFEPVGEDDNTDLEDTVSKTYESTPEQLSLDQGEATNTVGEQHSVTATVTDGVGDPVAGAVVRFEVDDTFQEDVTTDDNGQAVFDYSSTTAGDDTITACTTEDGTDPADCPTTEDLTDSQTKHWVGGAPASLDLEPEEATNTVGTDHTVVVTATDEFGNPVGGVAVRFEVEEGDGTATPQTDVAMTESDGTATFTYTNTTAGDDRIEACTDATGTAPATCADETAGENDNTDLVDAVLKHWIPDVANAQLNMEPEEATNTVGTQHTVTATVTDQHDNPLAGYDVRFYVEGSEATTTVETTGPDGTATFTYTGPNDPQQDVIAACSNEDTTAPAAGDCPTEPAQPDETANLVDRVVKNWVT